MIEQTAKIQNSCTVSGMRPTGPLHIGHYFGALKNFVEMQEDNKAFSLWRTGMRLPAIMRILHVSMNLLTKWFSTG